MKPDGQRQHQMTLHLNSERSLEIIMHEYNGSERDCLFGRSKRIDRVSWPCLVPSPVTEVPSTSSGRLEIKNGDECDQMKDDT